MIPKKRLSSGTFESYHGDVKGCSPLNAVGVLARAATVTHGIATPIPTRHRGKVRDVKKVCVSAQRTMSRYAATKSLLAGHRPLA